MLHVVTGGSGSGKSAFAEGQILSFGPGKRIYIATMYPGHDEENFRRIERHRRMRSEKQFETLECYTHLAGLEIPDGCQILLECMSNLVANEQYMDSGAGKNTVQAVLDGVEHLLDHAENLVIVTNEVFSDGITYDSYTEEYLQFLSAVNRQLAARAESVTEVVYGIPVAVKRTED